MTLSIIIVSWNVQEKLINNLTALLSSEVNFDYEVFVVDNNSGDGTVAAISSQFPNVKIIANKENLGFAKANNQAIKVATGKHILLLNPDMRVQKDTLSKMVTWFELHPQAMVASCKLVSEVGAVIPHVRRFPTITDQLAIVLKIPHLFPGILNKYLVKDFNYNLNGKVDSVRGSFFLMRRKKNGLPLLDERYFIWFEEVDYCLQVRRAGFEVWYTPEATCVDYIGASFNQVKRNATQIYFQNSMLEYFKKWHPRWQYFILKTTWPLGRALASLGQLIKFKNNKVT